MDLIFRQAKEVGLSVDDVMNAEPLPTTRAAMYAGLDRAHASMAGGDRGIDHRRVDERRSAVGRYGRRNCSRLYKIWSRDLISAPRRCQTSTAHSKADVKHSTCSSMFWKNMSCPDGSRMFLTTAKESMDIHRAYFGGMAQAMEKSILA